MTLFSTLWPSSRHVVFFSEGVEWGLIFPEANGENQSPINLNSREAQYDPRLLEVRLLPNYVVCRDCEVINDGHTVRIMLKSKSVVTGGPLPSDHEFELHEGKTKIIPCFNPNTLLPGAELPEGNDGMLGDNFRPTQPLSDRVVRAAFQ
ncbi:Carbonic anhydrase-related protein [Bagarius yarrelli]|uniref:Carbonic anhydrase-related protein n=1 Tax=Bagarius yarrelli TaxID=175774 RepID=A0A556VBF8_BAGYA|nr:Carbonic anhydrase-related protein [Bagarius yarrelli]